MTTLTTKQLNHLHLVMAQGACDVRYFDSKALPAVIEYVVTEEYIDEESE